jgi:hypothetical protein
MAAMHTQLLLEAVANKTSFFYGFFFAPSQAGLSTR